MAYFDLSELCTSPESRILRQVQVAGMCLYHPALQCHWEVPGFKLISDHKTFSDNRIQDGIFNLMVYLVINGVGAIASHGRECEH